MGKSIVEGTAQRKYGVVKTTHKAGIGKIRCPGCKTGMAVLIQRHDGWFYSCQRCGREYKADRRI